jgi:choline dehydrogenase
VQAGQEMGLPLNRDFNGAHQDGVGFYQVNQRNGNRHSTAAAYLKPILNRANLSVQTHAQVTRLLFENNRAIGVEYRQDGETKQAKASREIILAGGAINSPQLLMLSGIGSAEHLRALNIPVISDLPGVGKNLQDHLMMALICDSLQSVSLAGAESIGSLINYLVFKKGMLTSNVGEAGAFIKMEIAAPNPDIQIIFGPVYYLNHGFTKMDGHGFTIGAVLLNPQSAGAISLRSADPMQAPIIHPNYFAVESDLEVMTAGVKFCRRIAQAKAFGAYCGAERIPGAQAQSDEEIKAGIRNNVETLYHPVGTCKMGNDAMAVVNSKLQVRGVERLRVADAAIMPLIVSGNTNAPTIMIAEKAADIIKKGI